MALIVEVGFLPVKARTRLVESLASVIRQIREMETCIAVGIEEGVNVNIYDPQRLKRFERASGKVNGALAAAETFCESNSILIESSPTQSIPRFCMIHIGSEKLMM